MNKLKNIAFGLSGGWILCLNITAWAAVYALTIIGLKRAYALLKCAAFCLAPFGKNAHIHFWRHKFGNAFWAVTMGWQVALLCMLFTCFWYATIFGGYLGEKFFMIAQYSVAPFGAKLRPASALLYRGESSSAKPFARSLFG